MSQGESHREITVFCTEWQQKKYNILKICWAAKAVFRGKHHFKFLYLQSRFKLDDLKFSIRSQLKIKKINSKSRVKEAIKKNNQQNENRL